MKMSRTLLSALAGAALMGGLLFSGARLSAQDASPASNPQAQAGQDQSQQTGTFLGTIGKSRGTLVLKGGYASQDPNAKSTYKLDDQEKAKQYLGKNVKVTGSLDASTRTIHVSDIEPAS
jgi:hypothetical protein